MCTFTTSNHCASVTAVTGPMCAKPALLTSTWIAPNCLMMVSTTSATSLAELTEPTMARASPPPDLSSFANASADWMSRFPDHDLGALRTEHPCRRGADAAAGPGDDDHLIAQSQVHRV